MIHFLGIFCLILGCVATMGCEAQTENSNNSESQIIDASTGNAENPNNEKPQKASRFKNIAECYNREKNDERIKRELLNQSKYFSSYFSRSSRYKGLSKKEAEAEYLKMNHSLIESILKDTNIGWAWYSDFSSDSGDTHYIFFSENCEENARIYNSLSKFDQGLMLIKPLKVELDKIEKILDLVEDKNSTNPERKRYIDKNGKGTDALIQALNLFERCMIKERVLNGIGSTTEESEFVGLSPVILDLETEESKINHRLYQLIDDKILK